MEFFYYWPDYERDTVQQTQPNYKLHRETDDILEIESGDTVWCVASFGEAPKSVALAAKMIVKKSDTNDPSHPDYKRFGPNYFLADRGGTEFYEVKGQTGLESVLRKLSFPVRAAHVGISLRGANGFRQLQPRDSTAFRAYAASLSPHAKIKVKPKGKV